ncbi:competence protein ComJ [Chromobacterium haemolyticum]|nr:competence protein ComJ [Chromobacterium haemolyticum]
MDTILVSYNQICVFNSDMDEPFNDWNQAHVEQGFSWRQGSVSFGAIENDETELEITAQHSYSLDNQAIRAISVPFKTESGSLIIGSIGDEREIDIEPGSYELIFELGKRGNWWCRLTFIPQNTLLPKIIKADQEIIKTSNFDMNAKPAA